jgi:hypothetical protein
LALEGVRIDDPALDVAATAEQVRVIMEAFKLSQTCR